MSSKKKKKTKCKLLYNKFSIILIFFSHDDYKFDIWSLSFKNFDFTPYHQTLFLIKFFLSILINDVVAK